MTSVHRCCSVFAFALFDSFCCFIAFFGYFLKMTTNQQYSETTSGLKCFGLLPINKPALVHTGAVGVLVAFEKPSTAVQGETIYCMLSLQVFSWRRVQGADSSSLQKALSFSLRLKPAPVPARVCISKDPCSGGNLSRNSWRLNLPKCSLHFWCASKWFST